MQPYELIYVTEKFWPDLKYNIESKIKNAEM